MAGVNTEGSPISRVGVATIFRLLVRGAPANDELRRAGSIGLGRYTAREVPTSHEGTIEFASSAVSGTLFTVHLPHHGATA